MRFRRTMAVGLACMTLIGCSTATSPSPEPSSTSSHERLSDVSASQVKWPDLPGASSIQGLLVNKETSGRGRAKTSTVKVKSPSALSEAVNSWADAQNRAFADAVEKSPHSGQESLAMEASVCGASGPVICFLVNSTSAVGSQSTETSQSWFIDSTDGSIVRGEDLFTDKGASKARALVSATVRKAEGSIRPSAPGKAKPSGHGSNTSRSTASGAPSTASGAPNGRADADYLHGAYFDSDGSLMLLVPDPNSSSNASLSAYRLRGKGVEDLLTNRAKKLRSAIMEGTAPTPLPTPSPTPSPTPNPTPTTPSATPSVPSTPDTSNQGAVDCTKVACVALTFDDGPGAHTPQLLDTLKAKGVRATFFVTGPNVQACPDVVARAVGEGHVVGNHTWNHPVLSKMNPTQISNELTTTSDQIVAAGAPNPVLMRPPYGAKNPGVMSVIGQHGMVGVLWDVDTQDWKNRNADATTQRALAGAKPGSIILMHDIHPSSVQATGGLIDQLRARGYTLVTVPELLGNNPNGYVGREVYSQSRIR